MLSVTLQGDGSDQVQGPAVLVFVSGHQRENRLTRPRQLFIAVIICLKAYLM